MHPSCRSGTVAALALVALVASACQSGNESPEASASEDPPASTAASGAPSAAASAGESAPAGEETSVFDLEVGDCFSAIGEEATTVTVVDCEETHVYEAFFVFDHEASGQDPYPGDDEILNYADVRCQPPFEEYVGRDYESSEFWITSVTPSEETWAQGDREIVCTLRLGEDGQPTTGSAEGSGR